MLLAGELDAIVDPGPTDVRIRPVVADADGAYSSWRRRHGARAINHMVVVRESLSDAHPDVVRAVFDLLAASRTEAGAAFDPDSAPFGLGPNRRSLELAVRCAYEQRLIPRLLSIDELFDARTAALVP